MASTIWVCPDCGADLTDGYCPDCCVSWSWAQLTGEDDPPEYQHPEEPFDD